MEWCGDRAYHEGFAVMMVEEVHLHYNKESTHEQD